MPDYTKYDFNESKELSKNRLVLEVVCKYVNEHQNISYEELKKVFPDNFGKSNLGIIKNEDEIRKWEEDGRVEKREKRFFSNHDEVIYFNNKKLYVSSQWGGERFDRFLNYAKNELGYNIEKSNDTLILDELYSEENKKQDIQTMKNTKTKNIMLYGAPGVGKTYNYKRLISLIEEGKNESEIFNIIKENDESFIDEIIYENIKKDKRVEFVTFHQSYSYEDFIEGFRPNENGDIKLEDGTFKKLVDVAETNLLKSKSEITQAIFKEALEEFLSNSIENEELLKVNLKRKDSYFYIYDYNEKTIYFEKKNQDRSHTLSLATLEKMYYEETNTIIKGGLAPYYNAILDELLKIKRKKHIKKEEQKNFYIVIDEINRGNISKIFGELITLIEEDKRDNLEVTLPYSKEKFKIPSNLYIIATMNSTDKSIATIDIALRRRFTFLKMHPKPELVKDTNAKELMEKLNVFIKETRGEDFMLGHSYFMSGLDLGFIKEYKIKPLLEEYFYGDEENYNKALDVLGDEYR
ncbi:McrB family protein [Malaciobacter sp. WC5094]